MNELIAAVERVLEVPDLVDACTCWDGDECSWCELRRALKKAKEQQAQRRSESANMVED